MTFSLGFVYLLRLYCSHYRQSVNNKMVMPYVEFHCRYGIYQYIPLQLNCLIPAVPLCSHTSAHSFGLDTDWITTTRWEHQCFTLSSLFFCDALGYRYNAGPRKSCVYYIDIEYRSNFELSKHMVNLTLEQWDSCWKYSRDSCPSYNGSISLWYHQFAMGFTMDQQKPSMNEISNFVYYASTLLCCSDKTILF